eukprot:6974751-Prymnesium_polylepis.1
MRTAAAARRASSCDASPPTRKVETAWCGGAVCGATTLASMPQTRGECGERARAHWSSATCFGLASPSTSAVATVEPGCITTKLFSALSARAPIPPAICRGR